MQFVHEFIEGRSEALLKIRNLFSKTDVDSYDSEFISKFIPLAESFLENNKKLNDPRSLRVFRVQSLQGLVFETEVPNDDEDLYVLNTATTIREVRELVAEFMGSDPKETMLGDATRFPGNLPDRTKLGILVNHHSIDLTCVVSSAPLVPATAPDVPRHVICPHSRYRRPFVSLKGVVTLLDFSGWPFLHLIQGNQSGADPAVVPGLDAWAGTSDTVLRIRRKNDQAALRELRGIDPKLCTKGFGGEQLLLFSASEIGQEQPFTYTQGLYGLDLDTGVVQLLVPGEEFTTGYLLPRPEHEDFSELRDQIEGEALSLWHFDTTCALPTAILLPMPPADDGGDEWPEGFQDVVSKGLTPEGEAPFQGGESVYIGRPFVFPAIGSFADRPDLILFGANHDTLLSMRTDGSGCVLSHKFPSAPHLQWSTMTGNPISERYALLCVVNCETNAFDVLSVDVIRWQVIRIGGIQGVWSLTPLMSECKLFCAAEGNWLMHDLSECGFHNFDNTLRLLDGTIIVGSFDEDVTGVRIYANGVEQACGRMSYRDFELLEGLYVDGQENVHIQTFESDEQRQAKLDREREEGGAGVHGSVEEEEEEEDERDDLWDDLFLAEEEEEEEETETEDESD